MTGVEDVPPAMQLIADRCVTLSDIMIRDIQRALDGDQSERVGTVVMALGYMTALKDIVEETGAKPCVEILKKRLRQGKDALAALEPRETKTASMVQRSTC